MVVVDWREDSTPCPLSYQCFHHNACATCGRRGPHRGRSSVFIAIRECRYLLSTVPGPCCLAATSFTDVSPSRSFPCLASGRYVFVPGVGDGVFVQDAAEIFDCWMVVFSWFYFPDDRYRPGRLPGYGRSLCLLAIHRTIYYGRMECL